MQVLLLEPSENFEIDQEIESAVLQLYTSTYMQIVSTLFTSSTRLLFSLRSPNLTILIKTVATVRWRSFILNSFFAMFHEASREW